MKDSVLVRFIVLTSLVTTAVWVVACVPPAPATTSPAPSCPDAHEPNDTVEQARFMQFLTVEGYIYQPGDVDVFRTPATCMELSIRTAPTACALP